MNVCMYAYIHNMGFFIILVSIDREDFFMEVWQSFPRRDATRRRRNWIVRRNHRWLQSTPGHNLIGGSWVGRWRMMLVCWIDHEKRMWSEKTRVFSHTNWNLHCEFLKFSVFVITIGFLIWIRAGVKSHWPSPHLKYLNIYIFIHAYHLYILCIIHIYVHMNVYNILYLNSYMYQYAYLRRYAYTVM
jgi:hypothetical protein